MATTNQVDMAELEGRLLKVIAEERNIRREDMAAMEERLELSIYQVRDQLTGRVDGLETKVDQLDTKIDQMRDQLTDRIDQVLERLD